MRGKLYWLIRAAMLTGRSVIVLGPPGCGKTALIELLALDMGLMVKTFILSTRQPEDVVGHYRIREDKGSVDLFIPDEIRQLIDAGKGILFIDEVTTASPVKQAAALRLINERRLGDFVLPEGVLVVACANPPEMAAGGWDLSAPMANRFIHIDVMKDIGIDQLRHDWVDGMNANWGRPDSDREPAVERALVAAFHHRTGMDKATTLWLSVPKDESTAGRAWPSPRSWDAVAGVMRTCKRLGVDRDIQSCLVQGCVGEGAGTEFLRFIRAMDLPDPEMLLANPAAYQHDARGDVVYTVLSSVASAAAGNLTPGRWDAAWGVLSRAATLGGNDVAAFAAERLIRAGGERIGKDLALPHREAAVFAPLFAAVKKGV